MSILNMSLSGDVGGFKTVTASPASETSLTFSVTKTPSEFIVFCATPQYQINSSGSYYFVTITNISNYARVTMFYSTGAGGYYYRYYDYSNVTVTQSSSSLQIVSAKSGYKFIQSTTYILFYR